MGKSTSSSAPPPDPRLVEAQIKSMGYSDAAIQQIMKQSDELLPLQKQSMQFGLDTAKTAYDQSQADRQYALGKRDQLDAAQKPILDQAKNFNQTSRANELRGIATSDIQQGFAGAQGGMVRDLSRMGLNPTSGRMAAMQSGVSQARALAMAQAGTMANEAARQEGIQYRTTAANMLSGFPAMASGATGAGAGFGGLGLGYANSGLAGMNAGYGQAGGIAGQMGSNASGMYNAMGNYKNGQDQIAAQNNPMQTILGAAVGAGMAWGMNKIAPLGQFKYSGTPGVYAGGWETKYG